MLSTILFFSRRLQERAANLLQITSGLITVRLFDNRGMLHGDIHVDLKYNNHCYRIPAFLETPGFVNPANSEMLSENGNGNMWSTRRIVVIMISNIVLLKSFSTRITAWMALYRRNGHSGTRTPDYPVMSRAFWPTELNVLSRGAHCSSRVNILYCCDSCPLSRNKGSDLKWNRCSAIFAESIRGIWSPFSHPRWDRWNLWRGTISWLNNIVRLG